MPGTVASATVKIFVWLPYLLLCAAVERAAREEHA